MSEGRTQMVIGDVVRQVRRPVEVVPGTEYPLLGVRWYGEGPFLREVGIGGVVKAKRLFRTEPNDFIYNRLFAWKGSFGLITEELGGCLVSGEFPLFEVDKTLVLPGYLNLVMCRSSTWAQIERESTGSTATSRNRWKEERFLAWQVALPPIDEQRRVIDLATTLDKAAAAARAYADAAQRAMVATMADLYGSFGEPSVPTDQLAEHILGGAWGSDPGVEDTDVWALGPIAFRDDAVNISLDAATRRSLSAKRAASRQLRRGDIVLERSGGTEDQPVGRVIRAETDLPEVVPSDFMRLVRIDPERANAYYVYWTLWIRYHLGDTVPFQNKTTNIRNLRIPDYLASPIVLPSPENQARFVVLAESFHSVRKAARRQHDAIARMREAVVAELLSGEHEIPISYDELLERAS